MNIDPNFVGKPGGTVEIRPKDERHCLVFDVPNCEILWESGVARVILPSGAPLIVVERKA